MKSKSNNDLPTLIIYEGNFIADPLSTANAFNDFFSTVAQKVQSKILDNLFQIFYHLISMSPSFKSNY